MYGHSWLAHAKQFAPTLPNKFGLPANSALMFHMNVGIGGLVAARSGAPPNNGVEMNVANAWSSTRLAFTVCSSFTKLSSCW